MARAHPVKNLSGAGFSFEDRVGAWLAAAMLAGAPPLDPALGSPLRIDFQVQVDGWRLDDILVTFPSGRWCASVKSYAQVAGGTAEADFVLRAWQELSGVSGSRFDLDRDLLGMVTAPLDSAVRSGVHELIRLAREQDPGDLTRRADVPAYVSQDRHGLWRSFAKPDTVATEGSAISTSPAELLRRLRVVEADFEASPSQSAQQAWGWCADALIDRDAAASLWDALLRIVAGTRTAGGVLTAPILVQRLAAQFDLRNHPNYERDWAALAGITKRNIDQVADRLGGRLHLDRAACRAAIDKAHGDHRFLALVGPSGCGKSALAKAWVQSMDGVQFVWLQAEDIADLSRPGGSLQHPLRDVLGAVGRPTWIVVDGLDRAFSAAADAAVAELLIALDRQPPPSVGVLITAQQQEWARVADRLAERNAAVPWEVVPVTAFTAEEVSAVLDEFPALRDVVLRGRLSGVLRNPKVLDVVLRRLLAGSIGEGESLAGDEPAFALWYYERLARGSGAANAARGAVVMRIAEIQGDALQADTPLVDLDPAGLDHIDDLLRDGVCEERSGRVRFAHDLYGDWLRYQLICVHADELAEYLGPRLTSPLWHRAVRLHALGRLAAGGPEAWLAEMWRLGGDDLGLLHDLFLEALLFAGEPRTALESAWPSLVADDGRLLGRLLRRFLHTATVPNPALVATIRNVDANLEVHAATQQRVPYWPLWLPLLTVVSAHEHEALAAATDDLVRMANTWLRSTPETWPARSEAAALAISAGRRVLEDKRRGGYGAKERETRVWQAVLAAIGEHRDDVVDITATLIGHGATQDGDADEFDDDDEVDLEPPDVRRRGVDHTFAETCLETDALHPVIVADPDLAGELLFAILAPKPRRRRHSLFADSMEMRSLGMEAFPGWLNPLWIRGPFLGFMRAAPEQARAFTVSLVEAATERWAQDRADLDEPLIAVEIPCDDGTATLRGDEQVMQWYRGDSRVPSTLAAALMALEKWLYDEADAGHDIGPVAGELLDGTRSVAMAGLLIGVGSRHSDLFSKQLRPLLGASELYLWDGRAKLYDPSHLLIGLFQEPEQIQQIARDWYGLEHRRVPLEQTAQQLMLHDEAVAGFLSDARDRWTELLDDQGEPTAVRFLIAKMDPANWKAHDHHDGFTYRQFEAPNDLREEGERAAEQSSEHGFWLMMPTQCQKILAGEIALPEEKLDEFLAAVDARMATDPPVEITEAGVVSAEDSECGVAAVLLVQHRDWLRQHPERESWCTERLLQAAAAPRRREWFDSAGGGTGWSWDAFCAEALPILWAEHPDERIFRDAVARLALNIHFATIARLFAGTGQRRDSLGDDFARLQHLGIHIARFRVAIEVAREDNEAREAALAAIGAHLDSFVDATMDPVVPGWADLAVPPSTGRRRRWMELDMGYLLAAYGWLPPLAEARDDPERAAWTRHWLESVTALVRRLEGNIDPRDGEVEGTPHESEYALLRALPARIVEMESDDARRVWEPLLAIADVAHYWVERFITDWFLVVLRIDPTPDAFPESGRPCWITPTAPMRGSRHAAAIDFGSSAATSWEWAVTSCSYGRPTARISSAA